MKNRNLDLRPPTCWQNVLLHLREVLSLPVPIEGIEGALRSVFHVTHDMGVNHGRFDILVSQKGLDFTDVDAVHEEMSGETVTLMPSSA